MLDAARQADALDAGAAPTHIVACILVNTNDSHYIHGAQNSSAAMPFAEPTRSDCCPPALPIEATGSRRRRLWELDGSAHCPVLGVCLPIEQLRRIADKALPDHDGSDDYRLHCLTVAEAKRRGALCEALHKELERRFAPALRHAAALKSKESLASWWGERRGDERMPGALWAVLTHPRCDTVLETQVLADVHMLQHQCGAAQRVDLQRFEWLQAENAALRGELADHRQRAQQQAAQQQAQLERLQTAAMRQRAEAIGRETLLAALHEELRELRAPPPGQKSHADLTRQLQMQAERILCLERALLRSRQPAWRASPLPAAPAVAATALTPQVPRPPVMPEKNPSGTPSDTPSAAPPDTPAGGSADAAPPVLGDRAVLCVGGRPASVPLYRHIVERCGGRFLHHDGGEQQHMQRLDATLSAADLVICQAGCISHDAYWRVKEHCKRHGKRCVFVDNPGSASLRRALVALQA